MAVLCGLERIPEFHQNVTKRHRSRPWSEDTRTKRGMIQDRASGRSLVRYWVLCRPHFTTTRVRALSMISLQLPGVFVRLNDFKPAASAQRSRESVSNYSTARLRLTVTTGEVVGPGKRSHERPGQHCCDPADVDTLCRAFSNQCNVLALQSVRSPQEDHLLRRIEGFRDVGRSKLKSCGEGSKRRTD